MIWIGYTTLYREGGPKFERAARTMAAAARRARGDSFVRCDRIESKRDFVDAMARVRADGAALDELHFIGHSGMYGPMFRTTSMPEQFSPHEWRALSLPFAPGGVAHFHACRTARWFAPFFARTFGVPAHGYQNYTTISSAPDVFRWDGWAAPDDPLYVVACAGRKSHGLLGSTLKYSGLGRLEKMTRFEPSAVEGDPSYDAVAELYDDAFADIGVRADECRFIETHLPAAPRLLDIGCGNGTLLARLAPRLASGVGVDRSRRMIDRARARVTAPNVKFQAIDGPALPFADASFDVVVSLLSFRYLDWDPIMNEIRRVLAPGGRLLVVDMVTVPTGLRDLPRFARGKARQLARGARRPGFERALRRLVSDRRWRTMLQHNPIRSDHELRWYLESRFPGRRVEILNVGWNTRILGFDSGPLAPGWVAPQSYP
ncbi:MAG TPA: class I SAM-dependent methyltransferase [Polyangia bacterium]|nr:class I SAM-dependent methyltransferase [Polyangia bacterium]